MKYIDRPEIPPALIGALTDDSYSESLSEHLGSLSGEAEGLHPISVTTLPRSPRQRILFNRHQHLVEVDPIKMIWKLWGHVVHSILERFAPGGCLVEQRKGIIVGDYYLHGQPDVVAQKPDGSWRIDDYKVCSDVSYMLGDKGDHHAQLNVLRLIFQNTMKINVSELRNIYILREWSKAQADGDKTGRYPKEPIIMANVEIWPNQVTMEYISRRITAHFTVEDHADDDLPHCTPQERWVGMPIFKAIKLDPKTGQPQLRAKKSSNSMIEINDFLNDPENQQDAKGKEVNYVVTETPGKPVRCQYCEINQFCSQYRAEQAAWAAQQESQE